MASATNKATKKRPSRKTRSKTGGRTRTKPPSARRWSRHVMETSDALDLEEGVFKGDARSIARSLKRSAERSTRRKSEPYRSAMSMLTFYINRGGRNLKAPRKRTLEQAKVELRRLFGKETG